jgi:hypothetical protein
MKAPGSTPAESPLGPIQREANRGLLQSFRHSMAQTISSTFLKYWTEIIRSNKKGQTSRMMKSTLFLINIAAFCRISFCTSCLSFTSCKHEHRKPDSAVHYWIGFILYDRVFHTWYVYDFVCVIPPATIVFLSVATCHAMSHADWLICSGWE